MQVYENFISYRRSESMSDALLVYEKLVNERGKSTFLDVKTLGSGEWSPNILTAIDTCTNFIFIRNEHSLDRCQDAGDVVRREIKEAIKYKKNIILVSTCRTEIPKDLPDDISTLGNYNEIHYEPEYLDAFIDKLIKKFTVSEDSAAKSDAERDFIILDGGLLAQYVGKATIVEIPKGIVEIGSGAFKDQTKVTQIRLPDGLKVIGKSAFERCSKISSVEIPSSVTIIKEKAFARCYGLLNITMGDGVEVIEDSAFEFCEGIKSIKLGKAVKELSASALNNCSQLQWIEILEGSKEYVADEGIIYNKEKTVVVRCPENYRNDLIKLPETVEKIADYCFARCKSIQNIELPKTLRIIGEKAFEECVNIPQLTMPDSLERFSTSAIDGWDKSQRILMGKHFNPKLKYFIEQKLYELSNQKEELGNQFCLIKTVFEHENEAKKMARDLLDKHLIVSGQIVKGLNSLYIWEDKFQDEGEIELTCFTEMGKYQAVEKYIKEHHSYEVCELICIPILKISEEFGKWISDYVGKIM